MDVLKVAVEAILIFVLLFEVKVGDGHLDGRSDPISKILVCWVVGWCRRRQVGEAGGSRGFGEAAGSATSIKSILKMRSVNCSVESHIGSPRGSFSCAVIAFRPASCNWKLRSSLPIPRRVGSAAAGAENSRQYAPRTTPNLPSVTRGTAEAPPILSRFEHQSTVLGVWKWLVFGNITSLQRIFQNRRTRGNLASLVRSQNPTRCRSGPVPQLPVLWSQGADPASPRPPLTASRAPSPDPMSTEVERDERRQQGE